MRALFPTRRSQLLIALALACMAPPALRAQPGPTPLAAECLYLQLFRPSIDTIATQWAPFHPRVQVALLEPLVARAEWPAVLAATRRSLDSAAALGGSGAAEVQRLRARLERTQALVEELLAATDARQYAERIRRVGPMVFDAELMDDANDRESVHFFRGEPDAIVITDATPVATRRAVCWHAAVARWATDRYTGPMREDAVAFIAAKRALWTRYFEQGYSQLPWELALNSWFARKSASFDPPTSQVILAHPAVGAEVPVRALRDLERKETMTVEALGFLRYRKGYRGYWGASAVVTFTEGQGLGYGPLVHFGRGMAAGYVFRTREAEGAIAGERDHGVILSVDLYRFLDERQGEVNDALARIGNTVRGIAAR